MMDSKPIKNKVQEIFQKRGLPIPVYEYSRHGGEDHQPKWSASCKINNIVYTSSITYSSKSDASDDCAKQIYENLPTQTLIGQLPKSTTPLIGSKYHVWIDLDNSRHIWNTLVSSSLTNIVALRGFGGPRLEISTIPQISNLTYIYTTHTNMKDSADLALFADVLIYIEKGYLPINDTILIVSGDATLETACYILKERYPSLTIKYIAKASDLTS